MEWTEVQYTKRTVDKAGDTLINSGSSKEENDKAITVLNNWRSSHSFPLHIFKVRLKRVSMGLDTDALVAQRLKRTPAIINKLQRRYGGSTPTMKLSQMQDIGGCRAVLRSVNIARQVCNEYYHGDNDAAGKNCGIKHIFKGKKDYITNPKPDGYRSIHLIYKYCSDKTPTYNGLLIEIQVRSKLQHVWATAVETVDHFTAQAIKSEEGDPEWIEYFRLMGTVFANIEKTPIVPGTPVDKRELYERVKYLSNKLEIEQKVGNLATMLKVIEDIEKKKYMNRNIYLLELNSDLRELNVKGYLMEDAQQAFEDYSEAEKNASGSGPKRDIVLVQSETFRQLKKAYPNYFLDISGFLKTLKNYMKNPGF